MQSAKSHYQFEIQQQTYRVRKLRDQDRLFSRLRVAVFFITLALLGVGYFGPPQLSAIRIVGWIAGAVFLIVITIHENIRNAVEALTTRTELYEKLLARVERRWSDIRVPAVPRDIPVIPFSDDLDLMGRASLLHWICLAETLPARRLLLNWLAAEPRVDEIELRQEAVRELAPLVAERERVYLISATVAQSSASPENFTDWAMSKRWLEARPWLVWLSRLGPACLLAGIVAALLVWSLKIPVRTEYLLAPFGIGILMNLLLSVGFGGTIHDLFLKVSSRQNDLASYLDLFRLLRELPRGSRLLRSIADRLGFDEQGEVPNATNALNSLNREIGLVGIRFSPLFFLVYLALQLLVAWDFRVLLKIEKWQAKFGTFVPKWFENLAEFEVLASVAAVPYEHPQWVFPKLENRSECSLVAKQLGHPLIADQKRVCNDLEISTHAPLLLVTGSNMSGKSTFLRALGLNIVLARTGSPVCATEFRMPLLVLATSIRIRDSLDEGVSYFMAELRKLRSVVDIARAYENHRELKVFFLLDEIMQGTNSRERHVAVGHVVGDLLKLGAFGAVSTHDLDLASHQSLKDRIQVVHFRELVENLGGGRRKMSFDYIMRPGLTPTTNALKLLALVGLGGPEGDLEAK